MRIKKMAKTQKEFFGEDYEIVEKNRYGFEVDKPIIVPIVQEMYYILKNLRLKNEGGEIIDYDREPLKSNEFTGPVDHFEVLFRYVKDRKFCFKIYDLYFCAYPKTNDNGKDFILEYFSGKKGIEIPDEFELRR